MKMSKAEYVCWFFIKPIASRNVWLSSKREKKILINRRTLFSSIHMLWTWMTWVKFVDVIHIFIIKYQISNIKSINIEHSESKINRRMSIRWINFHKMNKPDFKRSNQNLISMIIRYNIEKIHWIYHIH